MTTETLYRTKTPHATEWREQFFELTMGEQTVDGQLGYFVRETQCWWDTTAKRTVRVQYTLSPREGFATMEEAHERFKLQRATRARHGFVHSFTPCYEVAKPAKYVRIEIERETKKENEDGA
ncbi:MAG TPA: hypothetical protein VE377_13920 [Candidatus Dormibacteraeota bacterium]|nr:hypothetical protein [Candidatus Dormibacteraeota bacterium]